MSTPTSTGGQPMSYKTNVNRAKTKRWVEAKSYSYDGDDWGDVDDYDEYGGYDEPAPPNKPTGLRQMGQSAQDYGGTQGPNLYQSPVSQDQSRGNFNQSNIQQPQGARSVTGPSMANTPNLQNSTSFDRGDERRSFSTGRPQQGGSNVLARGPPVASGDYGVEAQDFYQRPTYTSHPSGPAPGQYYQNQPGGGTPMEPHRRSGEHLPQARGNSGLRPDQSRNVSYDSGAPSITSQDSSLDFHDRRDFSPSAMPPPLQTRNSPSPQNDSRSRPPRKSSLGQLNQPALPFDPHAPPSGVLESRTDTGQRPRTGSSSSGKALPFVRPADIYKRIEEERVRERRSQDSSRPSMDAINRAADRPMPDARKDSESHQRVKPTLDPVTERKSDLGFEGLSDSDQGPPGAMGQRLRTTSKTFEIKKPSQTLSSQPSNLSPELLLPDPTRLSGFGEGFGESFMDSDSAFGGLARGSIPATLVKEPTANPQLISRKKEDQGLQHQPSKGFTSAVHQAFDTAQDQIPPTPSSTADSSIGRSASGGTSAVSPIMSRGPSAVDRDRGGELPSIEDVTTPTQDQAFVDTSKLPTSSRNSRLFAQHAQDTESPEDYVEEPPPGFKMGHRRDSGTPSPDNSPARTPALASMSHLRHPEAVDLAETTPTPTDSVPSASNSVREPEYSTKDDAESTSKASNALAKHDAARRSYIDSPSSPAHSLLRQRTDSAGSGRVKDLAGKFEGNSRPESRTSNTTPRASVLGPGAYVTNEPAIARPQNDRMESFRPHLPGGWESSMSIAPTSAPSQDSNWNAPSPNVEARAMSNRTSRNPSPGSREQRSADNSGENPRRPFSAAAEADSALAGAPIAAYRTSESSNTKNVFRDSPLGIQERSATEPRSLESHHVEPNVPSDNTSPTVEGDATNPAHGGSSNYRPTQDMPSAAASLPRQPESLPALSTNMQPRQYESDRLRREIVKELSPGVASEPTTAESDSPHQASSRYTTNESLKSSDVTPGALPSDYDSYWNEDSDEASSRSSHRRGQPLQTTNLENNRATPTIDQPSIGVASQQVKAGDPQPESQQKQKKPHVLAHRFSWEQPLADLDSSTEPVQVRSNAQERQPEVGPPSSFLESQVYPEKHAPATQVDSRIPSGPPEQQSDIKQLPISSLPPQVAHPSTSLDSHSPYDGGIETEKELPSYPAAPDTGIRKAEESVATDPPQTVGQTPTARGDQEQNVQTSRELSIDPDVPTTPLSTHEPSQTTKGAQNYLSPALPITQPKSPAFREITALKSPAERIRAFNDTRQQFANMNTGLQDWLAVTSMSMPEHEDVIKNGGMTGAFRAGHKASQSKSKLGSLITAQTSQPYYQQYLDATPQSGNSASTPGSAPPGQSPPQGFPTSAGSSGKISGQQVQAKSKEFLQSAGKYGGKANVAAKGLFSKGKSKLRDASGGKKAPYSATQPTAIESMQPQRADSQSQATSRPEYESSQPKSDLNTKSSQASPHIDTEDPARDAPSIHSVSQSQLGDDERSETSTAERSDRLPRFSRLYRKGNPSGAKKEEAQKMVTVPGSRGFVPVQPTGGTAVDRPDESAMQSQSPRSTGSSNKTPTQTNFDTSKMPHIPAATGNNDSLQNQAVDPESDDNRQSGPAHVVSMSDGALGPQAMIQPSILANSEKAATPRLQPDSPGRADHSQTSLSENSFEKATARREHGQPVYARSDDRHTPGSDSQPETHVNHEETGQPRSTLLSHNSILSVPGPPVSPLPIQRYSDQRPSLESLPSRDDTDRPPSPISPQFPIQTTTETRGRSAAPVHHGIDHDFGPETNMERARRRSRSFSRPFDEADNRRRSQGPDLQDHPAFQRQPSAEDLAMPEGFYPNSISPREALLPRQQAPEYALEGVGPPEFPPVQTKSHSRRGSRSSAFLKSFRKSYTDPDSPRLPASSGDRLDDSPADSSSNLGTRSKRSSVFHLRKSQTDLTNTQSAPRSRSSTATQLPAPAPVPPPKPTAAEEDDEFPMRAKSRSSTGFSKKLQRSSTAATGEGEGEGKKKRFSGIGSLFGRSQKRQSTVDHARKGSKDMTGPQPQRLASSSQGHKPQSSRANTSRQESFIDKAPVIEQPPVEGFYAPQRASSRQNGPSMTDNVQRPRNTRGPSSSSRADMPAYVQDSSLRQPSSPPVPAQGAKSTRSSIDFLRKASQNASSDLSTNRAAGGEARDKNSAWTRFSTSTHGRPKSRPIQTERLDRGTSNASPIITPSNSRVAAPPQNLYQRSARSDSPAPPPPPPKDEWHRARPRQSSLNAHAQLSHHAPLGPAQVSPPLLEHEQQRYFLPPLQTDVPSPSLGPIRSGLSSGDPQSGSSNRPLVSPAEKRKSRQREIESASLSAGSNAGSRPMSPEEKRRSRQIEIETGHLSPVRSPVRSAKEQHSLSPEDDERVVMSATSFPGQEWQPEGAYGGY